jgi:hypothetical protein
LGLLSTRERYGRPMAVLAALIVWKAVAIWIVLSALVLGVGRRLRTRAGRDLEDDGGHTAPERPVLQVGPRGGWYIRSVDWPDADL